MPGGYSQKPVVPVSESCPSSWDFWSGADIHLAAIPVSEMVRFLPAYHQYPADRRADAADNYRIRRTK